MKKRTILLVDDETEVLKAINRVLCDEPYNLLFAESGKEALDLLKSKTVHVVVTDLKMPEMDGFLLIQHIKRINPDIIRLVLSALSDSCPILSAINKGNVYRYITKPWNDQEMKTIIKQAVDLFNVQQEKRDLLKKLGEYNILLEKRVEERMRQLRAIESEAEIGKHASQIVHNLNTSLNGIFGSLGLAKSLISEKEPGLLELNELIGLAQDSADEIGKIISGILLHARDKSNFEIEPVDINGIIKKECSFFDINPFYKYKIEKQITLSDDLPIIQGNPIQIKQIVDNLIKNSIDAMGNSTEKTLIIETSSEDGFVMIKISDTGEGISEDNFPKIFSPEFTTKPLGKGTGLGLASVKTMVEAYFGDILVKSEKGIGTEIIIKLPVNRNRNRSPGII